MKGSLWNQQKCRSAGVRLGGIGDRSQNVSAVLRFLLNPHIERASFLVARQDSHDILARFQNFRASLQPVRFVLNREDPAFRVAVDQQVGSGQGPGAVRLRKGLWLETTESQGHESS